MEDDTYDVVIVGGGAAGLSAALVLGRARRRVVVIDAGASRNAPAARMHGFLSRDGMPPAGLLAKGRERSPATAWNWSAIRSWASVPGFTVRAGQRADRHGPADLDRDRAGDELPAIPGVRQRWGQDLLHCPYCHGWEVRDQPLGVLGARAR